MDLELGVESERSTVIMSSGTPNTGTTKGFLLAAAAEERFVIAGDHAFTAAIGIDQLPGLEPGFEPVAQLVPVDIVASLHKLPTRGPDVTAGGMQVRKASNAGARSAVCPIRQSSQRQVARALPLLSVLRPSGRRAGAGATGSGFRSMGNDDLHANQQGTDKQQQAGSDRASESDKVRRSKQISPRASPADIAAHEPEKSPICLTISCTVPMRCSTLERLLPGRPVARLERHIAFRWRRRNGRGSWCRYDSRIASASPTCRASTQQKQRIDAEHAPVRRTAAAPTTCC
jgi:hypothetical protein